MIDQVRQALADLRPSVRGQSIGVACSGGADSTALLLALAELRGDLGFDLSVVHLNHRLRGAASDADEHFVRELAASLGLTAHTQRVDVQAMAQQLQTGLEDAGRQARYRYFGEVIACGDCDRIATGHTLSDQAETLLFRLTRGSGVRGLAGIHPERSPGIIRPLLDASSDGVRRFLRSRGATWREDASNQDRTFRRNRIRLDIAPQLARLNPRWEEALGRTAQQALDEEVYWEQVVGEAAARLCARRKCGVRIPTGAFLAEPMALQRRLLRFICRNIAVSAQPSWSHIESLRALFRPGLGTGRVELGGLTARRSLDAVLLESAQPEADSEKTVVVVNPPAEIDAPDGRSTIRIDIASQPIASGRYTEPTWSGLDWSRLSAPLVLRPWQAGDRWLPDVAGREKKLQELLQQARVEIWDRSNWPVLAAGEEVVWARGFGVSARRRADGKTDNVLAIRETDGDGREIRGIEQWLESVYRV